MQRYVAVNWAHSGQTDDAVDGILSSVTEGKAVLAAALANDTGQKNNDTALAFKQRPKSSANSSQDVAAVVLDSSSILSSANASKYEASQIPRSLLLIAQAGTRHGAEGMVHILKLPQIVGSRMVCVL